MRQNTETQALKQHAKVMNWSLPGPPWPSDASVLVTSRNTEQNEQKLQTTVFSELAEVLQKSDFQSQISKHK